jgi:hypothetical protein
MRACVAAEYAQDWQGCRMRTLLYSLTALGSMLLALAVWAWLLDPGWRIERRVEITAPPGPVFAYISILRNWPEWTAWNAHEYPSLQYEYAGPDWGVGATQRWTGGSLKGELRVADFRPGEYLEYELKVDQSDTKLRGSLRIEPAGQGSRLTWSLWGESADNPFAKLMMRVRTPRIGRQFATGLANLQTRFRSGEEQHARQDP